MPLDSYLSLRSHVETMTNQYPEIAAVEERLRRAMLASDVGTLEALISPDLLFTNHLGQVSGKEDDLELHRSGVLRFQTIEPSEMRMKAGGELAVVSVRTRLSGVFAGSPFEADLRFTRVWSQGSGKAWQILAGHSSAIQG